MADHDDANILARKLVMLAESPVSKEEKHYCQSQSVLSGSKQVKYPRRSSRQGSKGSIPNKVKYSTTSEQAHPAKKKKLTISVEDSNVDMKWDYNGYQSILQETVQNDITYSKLSEGKDLVENIPSYDPDAEPVTAKDISAHITMRQEKGEEDDDNNNDDVASKNLDAVDLQQTIPGTAESDLAPQVGQQIMHHHKTNKKKREWKPTVKSPARDEAPNRLPTALDALVTPSRNCRNTGSYSSSPLSKQLTSLGQSIRKSRARFGKGPHVMTIFERDINMLSITPDTSLYSACRAWMAVDTTGEKLKASVRVPPSGTSFTLPCPNLAQELEYGFHEPSKLKEAQGRLDECLESPLNDGVVGRNDRLQQLRTRWKSLRYKSSLAVVKSYQRRYRDSFRAILRDIKSSGPK